MRLGLVYYGAGNLRSIMNAFSAVGYSCEVTESHAALGHYDKLILPGVGAFGPAIGNLEKSGVADALREAVTQQKKPILGFCLGMQLLFDSSVENGMHNGLGLIPGTVKAFAPEITLPVPHVGWNDVNESGNSLLLKGIPETERTFYFVHGYYCKPVSSIISAGITEYGISFTSIVESSHIFGCQFHPEKSQKAGLKILENFCRC